MTGNSSPDRTTRAARLDALVQEGLSAHQAGKLEEAEAAGLLDAEGLAAELAVEVVAAGRVVVVAAHLSSNV